MHWSWYAWIIQHIVSLSMHMKDSMSVEKKLAASRAKMFWLVCVCVCVLLARANWKIWHISVLQKNTHTLIFSVCCCYWRRCWMAVCVPKNEINCDRARSLNFFVCVFVNNWIRCWCLYICVFIRSFSLIHFVLCWVKYLIQFVFFSVLFTSERVLCAVWAFVCFYSNVWMMLNFEFLSRAPNVEKARKPYAYPCHTAI